MAYLTGWFICSFGLAGMVLYQDITSRLISLWLILLYLISCILNVFFFQNAYALLSNGIGTLLYMLFTYSLLLLFYYIKEKRFSTLINTKIGLADVILFFAIGLTLNITNFILFATISFICSALISFFVLGKNKTIPLGGLMVIFHNLFLIGSLLSD